MPSTGTQLLVCDLPVRFDTYRGCSHGCAYCFSRRKNDSLSEVETDESPEVLRRWVSGERRKELSWVDWKLPLHWGGLSDPFQPAERTAGVSLACLEVLRESGYPVVISTKGTLLGESRYLDLVRRCRAVVQVSMLSPDYDRLEPGAPSWEARLGLVRTLAEAEVLRVIVRLQPYLPQTHRAVLLGLEKLAAAGAYGVTVEALKALRATPGMEKLGGDYVVSREQLLGRFIELRDRCHELGLRFFCAENRLRYLGDDLTCCGTEALPDFVPFRANAAHYFYDPAGCTWTPGMDRPGTATRLTSLYEAAGTTPRLGKLSFRQAAEAVLQTEVAARVMERTLR